MLRIYKTEGIILKRKNLGEADRVLTVLTPYHGKIVLLAKGIRRIQSRRAPHLELFHVAQLTLRKGKTWDLILEAQTRQAFPGLRANLIRIAYAYRVAEAVDRLCAENQAHPVVFTRVQQVLFELETSEPASRAALVDVFTLALLLELGYVSEKEKMTGVHLQEFLLSITERAMYSDRLLDKVV